MKWISALATIALFLSLSAASSIAERVKGIYPLGGVGAILFGWFMDRYNGNWIIAIGYGLTAIFIYAIGQSIGTIALLMAIVFIAGTLMNTAQSSMPVLAASFI